MSLLVFFYVLALADSAITHFGVRRFGFGIENSPHFQFLTKRYGPIGFYISAFFLIAVGTMIHIVFGEVTTVGLCSLLLVILAWNLVVLISAELRLRRYSAAIGARLDDGCATPVRVLGESARKYLIKDIAGDLRLIDKNGVFLDPS